MWNLSHSPVASPGSDWRLALLALALLVAGCVTDQLPKVREEIDACSRGNCDPLILGGDASPEEMVDLALETCQKNGFGKLATITLDEESFRLYETYFRKERVERFNQLLMWREMYFLDPEFEVPVARFVPGMGDRSHGVRFASKHRIYCTVGSGFVSGASNPHTETGDSMERQSMVKAGMWRGHCFVRFKCR